MHKEEREEAEAVRLPEDAAVVSRLLADDADAVDADRGRGATPFESAADGLGVVFEDADVEGAGAEDGAESRTIRFLV